MANFNKVILLGNLTRDPEIRYTQGGSAVCKLGMAVNRRYSVNGEQKESTCFVDLVAFGRQAEVINEYCKKGKPLMIEGRLEFSQWESNDGQKRSKLEVVVEQFQFVGGREDGGEPTTARSRSKMSAGKSYDDVPSGSDDYDDVPF